MKKDKENLKEFALLIVFVIVFVAIIIVNCKIIRLTEVKNEKAFWFTLLCLSLDIFLVSLLPVFFFIDIYNLIIIFKKNTLCLRTKFNIKSALYACSLIFILICYNYEFFIQNKKSNTIGDAFLKWWFILPSFFAAWIVYCVLCYKILKKELKRYTDLFIEKVIKSVIIAIIAWTAISGNFNIFLGSKNIILNSILPLNTICAIFPLFFPVFDMYEYTISEIGQI